MRTTIPTLIVLMLAACQQNPAHQPTGEDEPFRRTPNRARDDARRAVDTGNELRGQSQRQKDPMLQNIRVEVTHIDDEHHAFERLSKHLSYNDGKTAVRAGETFARNGFAVGVVSGNLRLAITGDKRSAKRTRVRTQMVLVLNRHTAKLEVANVRRRLRVIFRTPRGDISALETLVTGARLVVSPEIVDVERELVQLRLWPETADLRADGSVEITGLESTIVVRNGQTLLLAADPEATESLAYSWFSKSVGRHVRQRMMLLRVSY